MTDKQIIASVSFGKDSLAMLLKLLELKCKNNKIAHQMELDIYNQECLNLQEELKESLEQLDQLKAKNEGLKKQYNCYACDTCNGKEDYINLKRHCENAIKSLHNKQAEFDQLKAENDELRQFLSKEPLAIQALQKSYESYQKSTKVFSDWVKDYKQLITEIKELCQKHIKAEKIVMANDILQKISECEGNDE